MTLYREAAHSNIVHYMPKSLYCGYFWWYRRDDECGRPLRRDTKSIALKLESQHAFPGVSRFTFSKCAPALAMSNTFWSTRNFSGDTPLLIMAAFGGPRAGQLTSRMLFLIGRRENRICFNAAMVPRGTPFPHDGCHFHCDGKRLRKPVADAHYSTLYRYFRKGLHIAD